ncbi:MAG: DUF924 domain-containing protein [Rhodobacteraceae bacterium]|nr:DUF924 domain-containing protein [Paracoccaceae bacterium]
MTPEAVLAFWLDEVGPDGWFAGGAELDGMCRDRFAAPWVQAAAGGLLHWQTGPQGALAYLILTDQLPRNMFRGQAAAFATDVLARTAAVQALQNGWDLAVDSPARVFFYLPFEHSEDAQDQAKAVDLMSARMGGDADLVLHARVHAAIIAEYGRFPSRNAALGRHNTQAEEAFFAQGGYGAILRRLQGGGG